MADWKSKKIVPSCAHGAACTLGQNNDILSAMSQFSGNQDVAKLQSALGNAMKTS
jgi:glucose/mannose transport system substrate-binding protein